MNTSLLDFLPHGESAVLIAGLVDENETSVRCSIAQGNTAYSTPEGIPSSTGIEILAQAAALLIGRNGMLGTATGGRLTNTRSIAWTQPYIPQKSGVTATVELGAFSHAGGLYRFEGKIESESSTPIVTASFSILIIRETPFE